MNWKIKACEVFYSPCLFFPRLQPHEMGEEGIPTNVEENPKLIWLQGRYTCIDKNIKFGPQFFSIAWQLLHLQEVENCFHWGVRICGRGETLVDFSSASCRLLSGKNLTRLKSWNPLWKDQQALRVKTIPAGHRQHLQTPCPFAHLLLWVQPVCTVVFRAQQPVVELLFWHILKPRVTWIHVSGKPTKKKSKILLLVFLHFMIFEDRPGPQRIKSDF